MKKTSVYLCYLLRHHPEEADLTMDRHGWVDVEELIRGVNRRGKYRLDRETLEELVARDEKGRYRFNDAHSRIKCCQGHSIPWVDAGAMVEDGFSFGMAENEVWLTDVVPARYICDRLYSPAPQ